MAKPFFIIPTPPTRDRLSLTPAPQHRQVRKLLADVIARCAPLKGQQVCLFNRRRSARPEGAASAERQGIAPQEFVDVHHEKSSRYGTSWTCRYNAWRPTTDPLHKEAVRATLAKAFGLQDPPRRQSLWPTKIRARLVSRCGRAIPH